MSEESASPQAAKTLLPKSFLLLLFAIDAAQNMTTSLLTLLFMRSFEPQQTAYFWMFMSWIYWCSPISGWVSDVCGNRKILLLVGLVCVIVSWCLITWEAESFKNFVVFGALQNASMLFVNSAVNGALVEISKAVSSSPSSSLSSSVSSSSSSSNSSSASASSLRTRRNISSSSSPPSATSAATAAAGGGRGVDENNNSSSSSSSVLDAPLVINNDDDDSSVNPQRQAEETQEGVEEEEEEARRIENKQLAGTMLTKSGTTQSTAMLAKSCGSVFGGVIQTFALVHLSIREALAISIALYFLATIVAVFVELSPSNSDSDSNSVDSSSPSNSSSPTGPNTLHQQNLPNNETFCTRVQSLFIRLRTLFCDLSSENAKSQRSAARDVVILLIFIFCNNVLPDATTFYQSYIFDAFEFPNWFNSCYQLGNLVGALVACEVYRRWLAPLSQTKVFAAGCIFAASSYVTGIIFCTGFSRDDLKINNSVYLMVDTFVIGFLSRLSFLPILHVASVRCPEGFEAVVFELFSLAAIGGTSVASIITIQIADALDIRRKHWDKLWLLMTVSAASRILPMLVVPHLPQPVTGKQQQQQQRGESEERGFSSMIEEQDEEEER